MSSDEDSEEWRPQEPKPKASSKTASNSAAAEKKAGAKRTAKPKEPKAPKAPKAPKVPKDPKPRASCKPAAGRKKKASTVMKDSGASVTVGTKRMEKDDKRENQTECPKGERAEESGPSIRMKEEVRLMPISVTIYLHTHKHTYTSMPERKWNRVGSNYKHVVSIITEH